MLNNKHGSTGRPNSYDAYDMNMNSRAMPMDNRLDNVGNAAFVSNRFSPSLMQAYSQGTTDYNSMSSYGTPSSMAGTPQSNSTYDSMLDPSNPTNAFGAMSISSGYSDRHSEPPTGQQPTKSFACSTCQKGFARRSDLVRHGKLILAHGPRTNELCLPCRNRTHTYRSQASCLHTSWMRQAVHPKICVDRSRACSHW